MPPLEPVRLSPGEPARPGAAFRRARPNPTQATPIDKVITDKPIIRVPGCPPIPDVMSAIITYMVTFDRLPDVDRMGRPLMFYGQRIHDKCYRRAHFDAGEFVQSWDDDAARKGYRLYKMGCKGLPPITPVPPHAGTMAFPSRSSQVTAAWVCAENEFLGSRFVSTAAWSIFHKWVPIPPPTPSV